jgi:hypothetical protein
MKKAKGFLIVFSVLSLVVLGLTGCSTGLAQINNPAFNIPEDAPAQGTTSTISVLIPDDFPSEAALILWIEEETTSELPAIDNAVDWFGKARLVQLNGLNDGYIINVDYDYNESTDKYNVYCTTVIEGTIYFWDPETDDLKKDTNLTDVP